METTQEQRGLVAVQSPQRRLVAVQSQQALRAPSARPRRAAEGVPYLPVWVVRPAAWARPQLEAPRFDGSGRVLLSQLRPISPAASAATARPAAALSPAAPNPNKAGGQR